MPRKELRDRYPDLVLMKLEDHVAKNAKRHEERQEARQIGYPARTAYDRSRSHDSISGSSWELAGYDDSSAGKGAGKGTQET